MSDVDRAPIEVSPQTVACPGHGEHLRAQWPKGFVIVAMKLFEATLASEDFMRAVDPGWDGSRPADFQVEAANMVLSRWPFCYWVDRPTIRGALMESGIGTIGVCVLCGRKGIGGPYSMHHAGRVQEAPHVCFECGLDIGERIHREKPDGGVWW